MSNADKSTMSRRDFVCRTGLLAGAALCAQAGPLPAAEPNPAGVPQRVLGRTGAPVTLFTLGTAPCGYLPPPEIAKVVRAAIDEGVTAIDTSEKYQNSQEGVGLALGKRRKDIFLSTKVFANSIAEAEESLAKSIKLLKTDTFDLLYYHSLGNLKIERAMESDGVFTWLVKQKKAGKCRFLGISGHNIPSRFPNFLETGEVDVLLAVVNPVDRHTYNFEERVLPVARKHQVGVVAMKVYGGAKRMDYKQQSPPQLQADMLELSLRYALSLPGVATANLGCCTAEEVRQNVRWVKRFKALSKQEIAELLNRGKPIAAQWGEHFGPVREKA